MANREAISKFSNIVSIKKSAEKKDESESSENNSSEDEKERQTQIKLKYKLEIRAQLKRQRLLEEVTEADKMLDLDEQDAYTMAFKALHTG